MGKKIDKFDAWIDRLILRLEKQYRELQSQKSKKQVTDIIK